MRKILVKFGQFILLLVLFVVFTVFWTTELGAVINQVTANMDWQPADCPDIIPIMANTDENCMSDMGNYEVHQVGILVASARESNTPYMVADAIKRRCDTFFCNQWGYQKFKIRFGAGENFWPTVCEKYPQHFALCKPQ